jgi:hypothetical protein
VSDVIWQEEFCRRCRDEHDEIVPAAGIVWGKLCPLDALGPRCLVCIGEQLGPDASRSVWKRDQQWAIYPLPIHNSARRQASSVSTSTCP